MSPPDVDSIARSYEHDPSFEAFVVSKATAEPAVDASTLHRSDLALAFGCLRGDRGALDVFERVHGPDVDFALKRSPNLGLQAEEFRQLVRTKLFVRPAEGAPKIETYGGRGPLKSWVRVTVARMIVDIARGTDPARPAAEEPVLDRIPSAGDPEIAYLKDASRAELGEAMKRAFAKLTMRQRNLLRQRFLFDLPAEKIATLYQVHRATAFGWIEEARRALVDNIRRELSAGRSKGRELESILALLGSRLDVSLRGVIGEELES